MEVHVILARTDKIEKIICLVGRFMDNFNVVAAFFFSPENTQTICLLTSNFSFIFRSSFLFSREEDKQRKKYKRFL